MTPATLFFAVTATGCLTPAEPPIEAPAEVLLEAPEAPAIDPALLIGSWDCSDVRISPTQVMESTSFTVKADGTYDSSVLYRLTEGGVEKTWETVNSGRYSIDNGELCYVYHSTETTPDNDAALEHETHQRGLGQLTWTDEMAAVLAVGKKDCYLINELSAHRLAYSASTCVR